MPKPDKVLRSRPLKEAEECIQSLKRVVLFHPDPIVMEIAPHMCVCGKGERKVGKKEKRMIQCDECYSWFHWDCAHVPNAFDAESSSWKCEWCENGADEKGFQRWTSGRKRAKLRHVNDRPVVQGGKLGEDPPPEYTSPPHWEGKVLEVQELSRRMAVKKRKLKVAVQELVDRSGHHLVDAEGMSGLELRAVDDGLLDEMVGNGQIDPDEMSDSE